MRDLAWVFRVGGSRFSVFCGWLQFFDYIATKSRGLSGGLCVCCLCGWLGFVSCAFVML